MKSRSQDSAKARWAIALFSVAIVVALYNVLPSQSSPAIPSTRENKAIAKPVASKGILEIPFRPDLFERRQLVSFENSRNIFRMQEERHVIAPGVDYRKTVTPDTGGSPLIAETVAPIDLKFFGYFRKGSEPKKVLVSQGDVIFVAQEGGLVGLRYKILEIRNNSVLVQDVLSNHQQSLGLIQ